MTSSRRRQGRRYHDDVIDKRVAVVARGWRRARKVVSLKQDLDRMTWLLHCIQRHFASAVLDESSSAYATDRS